MQYAIPARIHFLIRGRIKEKRKRKHFTQEVLAEHMGITVGYISQIERGTTRVNLDTLAQISNILECDIADLIASSNLTNSDYLTADITALLQQLNSSERNILYQLLLTYLTQKKIHP